MCECGFVASKVAEEVESMPPPTMHVALRYRIVQLFIRLTVRDLSADHPVLHVRECR